MAGRLKFETQLARFRKRTEESEYKKLRVKRLGYRMRNLRFPWEHRYQRLCKTLNHEP
jgi:hypothetical protein